MIEVGQRVLIKINDDFYEVEVIQRVCVLGVWYVKFRQRNRSNFTDFWEQLDNITVITELSDDTEKG